ncbi:MAG: NosD domain-containing protein [Candidatus Bathyarchaeia archaeon]|jgi:hypothetical protein
MLGINRKADVFFFLLLLFSFVLLSIPLNITVDAETKTIVVPDDYLTLQDAVSNASEGFTIRIKEGVYDEPMNMSVVINKTISIIGENPETTIVNVYPPYTQTSIISNLFFVDYSDCVTLRAGDSELKGLTIVFKPTCTSGEVTGGRVSVTGNRNNLTNNILQTPQLLITGSQNNITENTVNHMLIQGYYNNISKNTVLMTNRYTGAISVEGSFNLIEKNVASNILLSYAHSNNITKNRCERIEIGSHGMSKQNIISENVVNGKETPYNDGGILIPFGSDNLLYGNNITNFGNGKSALFINVMNSGNNTFYRNNFVNNSVQVDISKPGADEKTNFWDNGKEGNYWSDYYGTDANGDGIGDTPFIIDENRQDNYPLMEPFVLSGDIPEDIPEFSSWLILPILASVAAMEFLYKRKLAKTPN